MREEVKTRLAGAGGALITSVTLAALRSGRLGEGYFSLQLAATLVVLSFLPYLYRTALLSSVPTALLYPLTLIWGCLCFAPVFLAFIVDLFTGHRVEGAGVFNALWRVYAIIALWIGFAVCNERFIRPWWREFYKRHFDGRSSNSLSGQARQMTFDKRDAALEAIKARVVVSLKKKKLAERTIETKKTEKAKSADSIRKAEKLLESAKKRAGDSADNKEEAAEEVDAMTAMLDNARSAEKGLDTDVLRAEIDLQEIQTQLEMLQHEWTEALHIENYTAFYR